jgi:hypothetical protein
MNFIDLLEDFNVAPKSQNAIQSGPDIGMTTGDMGGTFPNQDGNIAGKLLPDEVQLKLNKTSVKKLYKLLSSALED